MGEDNDYELLAELEEALHELIEPAQKVNACREAIRAGGTANPTKALVKDLRDAEKQFSKKIDEVTKKSKDDGKRDDIASLAVEVVYETEHGVYINGVARAWVRSRDEFTTNKKPVDYSSSSSSSSVTWP